MANFFEGKNSTQRVLQIVLGAGGEIVGRTKLQKVAYLLEATGHKTGFSFAYKHYGPFSAELAQATKTAALLNMISEDERSTSWGGTHSIYTAATPDEAFSSSLAKEAAKADSVELELAATAAFLAISGYDSPWDETSRRKPSKITNGRLERAKQLYEKFQAIDTPEKLPVL